MPTRIRLKRVGAKKNPHYRIVVMASSKPRDGAAVEELGYYDPRSADAMPVFKNEDRALHWLMTGAQPSDTAKSLLRKAGIWAKFAAARDKHPSAGTEPPLVPATAKPVAEDEAEEASVAPATPEPVAEDEAEEAPVAPATPEPVAEDEAEEAPVAPATPEPVAEDEAEEAPAEE